MNGLPTGWTSTTFAACSDIKLGKMLDQVKNVGEPTDYLRNINVRWGDFDLTEVAQMRMSAPERVSLDIRDGDVLVCEGGEPGRAAVWDRGPNSLTFQKALMRVRPRQGVEPRYLAAVLRQSTSTGGLAQHFTGTTIKHLPQAALSSVSVPLPPVAEQRRIVGKIDRLSVHSRRARDELERVTALVRQLKQRVLEDVYGEGENRWPKRPISDFASVGTGATPKRDNPRYYEGGRVPWVTSGCVNNHIVEGSECFITEAAIRETNCKVYPVGTLLVAMYGEGQTRGKVSVLRLPAATNQALAAISVDGRSISTEFLLWFLRCNYLKLREQAAGGVQPNLNLGIIKSMLVPLPDMKTQAEIVRRIEHAFTAIDRLAAEAQPARALLDKLDQAILAKAFRGELVPQDPNDEPASVLLERIRAERAAAPALRRGRKARTAT